MRLLSRVESLDLSRHLKIENGMYEGCCMYRNHGDTGGVASDKVSVNGNIIIKRSPKRSQWIIQDVIIYPNKIKMPKPFEITIFFVIFDD